MLLTASHSQLPCVGWTSLTPLQTPLLSLLLRSVIHHTYGGLAPNERAAWTSSWVLRSLYLCRPPAISLSRFLPFFCSLAHTLTHLSCSCELLFFIYFILWYSARPPVPKSAVSPRSMSVSFLICLLIICTSNLSKVTPLPHSSPSSSLILFSTCSFSPCPFLLTKHRRLSWPCPSAV